MWHSVTWHGVTSRDVTWRGVARRGWPWAGFRASCAVRHVMCKSTGSASVLTSGHLSTHFRSSQCSLPVIPVLTSGHLSSHFRSSQYSLPVISLQWSGRAGTSRRPTLPWTGASCVTGTVRRTPSTAASGQYSLNTHSVLTQYSVCHWYREENSQHCSVRSVLTQHSHSTHSVFTQYSLSTHSVLTQYSLSTLTQYSLSTHSVLSVSLVP